MTKPLKPFDVYGTLEGASAFVLLADNIEKVLGRTKGDRVTLPRDELAAMARMLRLGASMFDRLIYIIEKARNL